MLITSGATEALTDCMLGLVGARRRSDPDRAQLRFLSADARRRRARRVRCLRLEPPKLAASTRRRWPPCSRRTDQADHDQLAAQSDRAGVRPRGAGAAGAIPEALRRLCRVRRGLRASRLRRPRAHSADLASRHAGTNGARGLGRKDVLADGMEDRLGRRAGPPRPARSPRRTNSTPSRPRRRCSSGSRMGSSTKWTLP